MSKIWVTRTEPGASETAARLIGCGYDPLVAPLMTVENADVLDADPSRYQAVLFTSANGVRAFARLTDYRPCALCVGDATRDAVLDAGFPRAASAMGDAKALVAHTLGVLDPADGPLLYAGAEDISAPVHRTLRKHGFEVDRAVLYRSVAVTEIPEAAQSAIAAGEIGIVLFHSRRAAEIFSLIVPPQIARLFRYAAISENAAEPFFIPCETADAPDEDSLLAALDRMTGKRA